jgi:large subunit ribosomal protein L25
MEKGGTLYMVETINIHYRNDLSHSHLRNLRNKGFIPGVVYGKKVGSIPIEVDKGELTNYMRKHGKHAFLQLRLDDGKVMFSMIHQMQTDPIAREIIHVDFHQINKGEMVNTVLPIVLQGTPAGVKEGGVMQQQLEELHVRCLPEQLVPIEVDVSQLMIGDSIRVSDISIPEGIEIKNDPEDVIVSVTLSQMEPLDHATKDEEAKTPEMVEQD